MPRKQRATKSRLLNLSKKKKKNNCDNYGKPHIYPSQSQTAEPLLLQTAVLDEPDTSDTNDNPLPNEVDIDSEGSCVEILDAGSDTDICE